MTPGALARMLWAMRQESLCHDRMIGLGTDELWVLLYSGKFVRLFIMMTPYDLFWIATITGGVIAALVGLDALWGWVKR